MKAREKRWVVQAGDGATVEAIVRKLGDAPGAIAEGRVFVGRKRVARGEVPVAPGDVVRVGAPPSSPRDVEVLFQRGGLVACVKPSGVPTVADHAGASHALVPSLARALGRAPEELRVTSRLDREVSGVVVFALTAEAEARLKRARAEGRYARRYVAIASSADLDAGTWDAPIGRGKDARHRAAMGPDAKASRTRYAVVARAGAFALLAVEPVTGRTHQIRVHASHAGAPLLGDRDYGGPTRVTLPGGRVLALGRIALHAARVTVPDARGEPLVAEAPVPDALARAWRDLGGAPDVWDTAVACALHG